MLFYSVFLYVMNAVYANADFQNIILTVLALVVILVLVGCVYTFIRAIILFIFSHSKEENKKKGWNSIRFMIIGVILTILLLFMVPVVLRWMKVPQYDAYTPTNIFSRAGELVKGLFDLGDIIKESQSQSEYRGQPYQNIDSTLDSSHTINEDAYSL